MNHPAQWWLLSDLHLGVSDDDPRHPGSWKIVHPREYGAG